MAPGFNLGVFHRVFHNSFLEIPNPWVFYLWKEPRFESVIHMVFHSEGNPTRTPS